MYKKAYKNDAFCDTLNFTSLFYSYFRYIEHHKSTYYPIYVFIYFYGTYTNLYVKLIILFYIKYIYVHVEGISC